VRGVDARADYRVPLPGFMEFDGEVANLSLQAVGSWMFERSTQVPGSVTQDCAGFYGAGCSRGTGGFIIPDFKLNLNATYHSGPLTVRGQGRMIGGLDVFPTLKDKTIVKSAPAVWYFDLTANVDLSKNFTFFAGVNNLFDKMPPILGTTFVGDANVDVSLYDTLGRRYFAGLRVKF
jgi:outer membrane receptor protein involved in Fe transport